ncbi:hypothetical protein ACFV6E_21070 [Streptomyces sp. NPDC059785]|uniref:hypothetical protein n=1 Tax=unclassified Streptomyces TaxID=2593676 RepID=UPI0036481A6A
MRRRTAGLLAALAALAGSVAVTTPASAEVNHPTCPKGAFCAYSEFDQGGTLLLATKGNWSGAVHNVKSTFNNGYRYPGADHVQLGYTWVEWNYSTCIHYAPGPGEYATNWAPITITSVTWRGEC